MKRLPRAIAYMRDNCPKWSLLCGCGTDGNHNNIPINALRRHEALIDFYHVQFQRFRGFLQGSNVRVKDGKTWEDYNKDVADKVVGQILELRALKKKVAAMRKKANKIAELSGEIGNC